MIRSLAVQAFFWSASFLLGTALPSSWQPIRAEDFDWSRFETTTICSSLVQPMDIEIAPDGSLFLIEINGTVKRIDPTSGQASVVGKLKVTQAQENGLIGLALDPDFANNGWIYLHYSPPDFSGQHLSRFDFRDGQIDMASEKLLFKYEEQREQCCHHAGSLAFDAQGNLYIGTGDNTNPFDDSKGYAPIDGRDGRKPWDAARSAGNTKSYNGKVLRIHPEPNGTYSIPDGNLFPKDGSVGHPEIYVMGCRNPWRISVDRKTGYLYWGDVGPDAGSDSDRGPRGYDEVNQARKAGNFGWPFFIGDNYAYPVVDFVTGKINEPLDPLKPVNSSPNNNGSRELPSATPAMIFYPAAATDRFPEVGSGGRTACAGPVYYFDPALASERKFPERFDSTLFAYEWSRNWILAVHLNEHGDVQSMEPFLPETKIVRPVAMKFDSKGSLYVIQYGETWGVNPDAKLLRIDYVRGNRKPVAVARATNSVGKEPLVVKVSGMESSDKDGDALKYQWNVINTSDKEAQRRVVANSAEAEIPIDAPGVYTLELVVTDPSGASSMTTLPAIVGNSLPQLRFIKPQDGDFFTPGQKIEYQLVIADSEDGTNDPDKLEQDDWELIESTAPSRTFVESIVQQASAQANEPPGLSLIRKSDCLNCHASNRPLVGPSFVDIAKKYRDQPHELEKSVQRVIQGSSGVWGKVGMLPHAQHTPAEVQQMVQYVYSVNESSANASAQGFANELPVADKINELVLEASYTDLGKGEIPKATGVARVRLRSRNLQAEAAAEFKGAQQLNSGEAEGGHFMGAIQHDGFLRYDQLRLDTVKTIELRVASAGVGGDVEIHQDTVDGPLLGRTSVEVNGNWTKFYTKSMELQPATGVHTIYVIFKNENNRGGLMNIDSLTFK